MSIRPAMAEDAGVLNRIVESAYGLYVARIGRRPAPMDDDYAQRISDGRVFVADDGGEIVGLIVVYPAPDHLFIENVAVHPDHQGEGVGGSLLAHAETYARREGLSELRLYTNAAMTENLALYPRLGYTEQDRRTEDGFERVFFSKRLEPG